MFSFADRLLFEDRTISTFFKSWIVFYTIGLQNENYRQYLLNINGLKPWDRSYSLYDPVWKFYPDCCIDHGGLSIAEASSQWQCFIDKWATVTLYTHPFEIILTDNMGLGLRTTARLHFSILSEMIDGFLEFISEPLFRLLTRMQYRSLYTYLDSDGNRFYCILFGPLSLANSYAHTPVGFSNTQDDGLELRWKSVFVFGFDLDTFDEEEDGSCCTVRYPYHRFFYYDSYNNNDDDGWEDFPEEDGFRLTRRQDDSNVVSQNIFSCLIHRVKMSIVNLLIYNSYVYEANQDILVYYSI